MHGCMTPNSKFSNRTLKKSASFVLASLRDSTYRKGTPRLFARCGRADGLFEHPAERYLAVAQGTCPPVYSSHFIDRGEQTDGADI